MVFLKRSRRSFLRLECTLNVLNSSQQPVRLTSSSSCPGGGGGGGVKFISGGNIFLKTFSINLCKGIVILEGDNIFSKSPESLTSVLFLYCQVHETNIYKGVIIFYLTGGGGGGGRNGMKDSVKFLIAPWKQQKNC